MISVTFLIKKTQDGESVEYLRSRQTDDMFLQVFAFCHDVLSTLSHDEVAQLYERARLFAPCLDDVVVGEQPSRERAPTSVAPNQSSHYEGGARDSGPTPTFTTLHVDRTDTPYFPGIVEAPGFPASPPETDVDGQRIHISSEKQGQALSVSHRPLDNLDNLDDSAGSSTQPGNHLPNGFDFAILLHQAAECDNASLFLESPATHGVTDCANIREGSAEVEISAEVRSTTVPLNPAAGSSALDLIMQNKHVKATDADGIGRQHHINTDTQPAVPQTAVPGTEVLDISSSPSNNGPSSGMVSQTASRSSSKDIIESSDLGMSTATSPGDAPLGAVSAESDEMEIDGVGGARANKIFMNESLPAREETPVLNPTHSYPTPQSNPPGTPFPARERIETSANSSPSKMAQLEVLSPCPSAPPADNSTRANMGTTSDTSSSISTGTNHLSSDTPLDIDPDPERDHDPMCTEDDLGDEEMESILGDAYEFLKGSSDKPSLDSETEPKNSARARESPKNTYPGDAAVSELALPSDLSPSCTANVPSPASRQTDDDIGVGGYSNNRKRKRTQEADDPTARRASHDSTSSNGSIQASASQSSLLADDEDLVVSDDLSSLGSSPAGSPLLEPAVHSATPEPSPLDTTFSTLTEREKSQVRRTGDNLLMPDFPRFLEQHSRHWFASGFWNGATWNINQTSSMSLSTDRAGLISYLVTLQNEDEMQYLRLLVSRVLLFLLYEREIECERRRGTAATALKQTATNNLCHTSGLSGLEKRKMKKSFHNHKRLGEYWWWCARFFGPSFLLRCSREAAKKINNTHFSLDALIAYVLNDQPHIVKPFPALDMAVVHLLTTGEFPQAFTRQAVRKWEKCASTASQQTAHPQVWQAFSTEAVSSVAQSHLQEWVDIPENRLLAFEVLS